MSRMMWTCWTGERTSHTSTLRSQVACITVPGEVRIMVEAEFPRVLDSIRSKQPALFEQRALRQPTEDDLVVDVDEIQIPYRHRDELENRPDMDHGDMDSDRPPDLPFRPDAGDGLDGL